MPGRPRDRTRQLTVNTRLGNVYDVLKPPCMAATVATQTRCANGLLLLHIYSVDYLYAPAVVNCEVGSTGEQGATTASKQAPHIYTIHTCTPRVPVRLKMRIIRNFPVVRGPAKHMFQQGRSSRLARI